MGASGPDGAADGGGLVTAEVVQFDDVAGQAVAPDATGFPEWSDALCSELRRQSAR